MKCLADNFKKSRIRFSESAFNLKASSLSMTFSLGRMSTDWSQLSFDIQKLLVSSQVQKRCRSVSESFCHNKQDLMSQILILCKKVFVG